jgi:hypothetical protein
MYQRCYCYYYHHYHQCVCTAKHVLLQQAVVVLLILLLLLLMLMLTKHSISINIYDITLHYDMNYYTRFGNGCLGSHIDEERSKKRYVMRLAKLRESLKF